MVDWLNDYRQWFLSFVGRIHGVSSEVSHLSANSQLCFAFFIQCYPILPCARFLPHDLRDGVNHV